MEKHINVKIDIPKYSDYKYADVESIINKPIIVNEVPIGIITKAVLNEEENAYECEGIIWDRFVGIECSISDNKTITIMGIVLGD